MSTPPVPSLASFFQTFAVGVKLVPGISFFLFLTFGVNGAFVVENWTWKRLRLSGSQVKVGGGAEAERTLRSDGERSVKSQRSPLPSRSESPGVGWATAGQLSVPLETYPAGAVHPGSAPDGSPYPSPSASR